MGYQLGSRPQIIYQSDLLCTQSTTRWLRSNGFLELSCTQIPDRFSLSPVATDSRPQPKSDSAFRALPPQSSRVTSAWNSRRQPTGQFPRSRSNGRHHRLGQSAHLLFPDFRPWSAERREAKISGQAPWNHE